MPGTEQVLHNDLWGEWMNARARACRIGWNGLPLPDPTLWRGESSAQRCNDPRRCLQGKRLPLPGHLGLQLLDQKHKELQSSPAVSSVILGMNHECRSGVSSW